MKKENNSLLDILRKNFRARAAISDIAVSRYPKSWRRQTDYNPIPPGSDRPAPVDMRPKAVEERERQARNSLIVPLAIIIGAILVFGVTVLIKIVF